MSGIYAIINTLAPRRRPYAQNCPAPLAALTHLCYIGQANDFERRWKKDHLPYLLNGQHCCSYLLDAFWDWLGADISRLELLAPGGPPGRASREAFKSRWLVRTVRGGMPEWTLGSLEFRVLEEASETLLTARETVYHDANVDGYRGSDPSKRDRRWQKWDGTLPSK